MTNFTVTPAVGDGETIIFNLSAAPTTALVLVGHAVQLPTTDYVLSGTALTFTPGSVPPAGAKITVLGS